MAKKPYIRVVRRTPTGRIKIQETIIENPPKNTRIEYRGKSTKQIKEEVIPALKYELSQQYHIIRGLRIRMTTMEKRTNELNKEYKEKLKKDYKDLVKKHNREFRSVLAKRVTEEIKKRFDYIRIKKSKIIDGALIQPCLNVIGKNHGLTDMQFTFAILLVIYGKMTVRDIAMFGYKEKILRQSVETVVEKGYINKFLGEGNRMYFTASTKAIAAVAELKILYSKTVAKEIQTDAYKKRTISFSKY